MIKIEEPLFKPGDYIELINRWGLNSHLREPILYEGIIRGIIVKTECRGPTPGAIVMWDVGIVDWCPLEYFKILKKI